MKYIFVLILFSNFVYGQVNVFQITKDAQHVKLKQFSPEVNRLISIAKKKNDCFTVMDIYQLNQKLNVNDTIFLKKIIEYVLKNRYSKFYKRYLEHKQKLLLEMDNDSSYFGYSVPYFYVYVGHSSFRFKIKYNDDLLVLFYVKRIRDSNCYPMEFTY